MKIPLWGSEVGLETALDMRVDGTVLFIKEVLWDWNYLFPLIFSFSFFFPSV